MRRKPSPKLLAFRTQYLIHGNATLAAKEAQYKNPNVIGPRLAHHPTVRAALEAKQGVALHHAIADRTERQEFWTKTMRDETLEMQHRHKGSELLAKSEGDFIEKLEIESPKLDEYLTNVGEEALLRIVGITDVPKGGYRTGMDVGLGNGNGNGNGHHRSK